MSRSILLAIVALVVAGHPAAAQDEAKVQQALSAAPAGISSGATVMDWDQRVLRQGSNAYTCLPDLPESVGNDPMCLDVPWMAWVQAFASGGEPPAVPHLGIAYMFAGDAAASNTDPFATGPTADNEWMSEGMPHVMLIVPDADALSGMSTNPGDEPWVMWRDSPFVHVMVPLARPGGMLIEH